MSALIETPRTIETGAWEDILRPGLDVVFIGYNPSLPAWRTGHYYANPSNRFYRLLHESGLTPRLLSPSEDRLLPTFGIGATDLLPLPSARADLVPAARFREAAPRLREKIRAVSPRAVCCNGVGVHRYLIGGSPAGLGLQPEPFETSALFVVPSTSSLCNKRSAQRLAAFRSLAAWLADQRERGSAPLAPRRSDRNSAVPETVALL